MIILISGEIGQGKSSLLGKAADRLLAEGQELGGFISERQMQNGLTSGYYLRLLPGNQVRTLSERCDPGRGQKPGTVCFGSWFFYKQAISDGLLAIKQGLAGKYLVIDEVGLWELNGGGWSPFLPQVFAKPDLIVLLGVRKPFVQELVNLYQLAAYSEINLNCGFDQAFDELVRLLELA